MNDSFKSQEEIREGLIYEMRLKIVSPCHPKFPDHIGAFCKRLPFEVLEFFSYDKDIMLIQPTANTIWEFSSRFANENITFIIFVSDLFEAPPHEIMYTVAHEFAHVFLGHENLGDHAVEKEADLEVIKWGFEEELKNCKNYLS